MIGFAARPGADVEPMCSTSQALLPSLCISSAAVLNWSGQDGSYGTSTTRTLDPAAVEPLPGRRSLFALVVWVRIAAATVWMAVTLRSLQQRVQRRELRDRDNEGGRRPDDRDDAR